MAWVIGGGAVLGEDGFRTADLALNHGVIVEQAPAEAYRFDASGLLVLPGIIDIHGDAHERQMQPRPGVAMPLPLALRDTVVQLVASGITTAYLGVTLSWEPGLRSLQSWRGLRAAVRQMRPQAAVDLRIHLRFEADNFAALEEAEEAIAAGEVHLLGFNDHTPGIARRLEEPAQVAKYAARAGLEPQHFRHLVAEIMARRAEVPAARARLAQAAQRAGIPMLSHDDATVEERQAFRALGAMICEFPMTEEVARAARRGGDHVVMGAPNVVRGGSHLGWVQAAPLVENGVVTILASDYYWPSLLEAVFVLVQRGRMDLAQAWALISHHPAVALGLSDRGRLAPGLRGDVVIVDPAQRAAAAVFVDGRLAWIAPAAMARFCP